MLRRSPWPAGCYLLLVASTLHLAASFAAVASADEWITLFNGQDLSGWTQRGGKAKYTVEEGAIVGRSVPLTPNSFLCTDQHFANFILELEFQVDGELNSGIQFRSNAYDQPTQAPADDGSTKTIAAGRVHGYQFEIDYEQDRNRWWAGGIYDESRRGWLFPGLRGGDRAQFTQQGRRLAQSADGWHRARIEAAGSSIKTFLDGEPRADFSDDLTPEGFIALQVHGVGARTEPLTVRWRNIRLQPLPASSTP